MKGFSVFAVAFRGAEVVLAVRSQMTWPFLGDVAKQVARSHESWLANPQVGAHGTSATDVRSQFTFGSWRPFVRRARAAVAFVWAGSYLASQELAESGLRHADRLCESCEQAV
jgi:hypothetical protein